MTHKLDQPDLSGPSATSAAPSDELRFGFGENWRRFVTLVDPDRIAAAERDLQEMLGLDRLTGMRLLDAGCGSGLASLAARRLGARVVSFDLDPDSVTATEFLRHEHYGSGDAEWAVSEGSVLDGEFLDGLGEFDIVHSWGVLHHTGAMWDACSTVNRAVAPGGRLFIAIYNDQGAWSDRWKRIKRLYCSGRVGRLFVTAVFVPALRLRRFIADLVWLRNPFAPLRRKKARGMSPSHDMRDWLGGYPFEVAKPEEVCDFYTERGFRLEKMKTVGGSMGCNVFVFRRESGPGRDPQAGAS
jgi:2-polyprenyl-3-methyl-5-hydroxy-6-metoxy-1,4-benzoquinol methylase